MAIYACSFFSLNDIAGFLGKCVCSEGQYQVSNITSDICDEMRTLELLVSLVEIKYFGPINLGTHSYAM